jgi:hypothetical protein
MSDPCPEEFFLSSSSLWFPHFRRGECNNRHTAWFEKPASSRWQSVLFSPSPPCHEITILAFEEDMRSWLPIRDDGSRCKDVMTAKPFCYRPEPFIKWRERLNCFLCSCLCLPGKWGGGKYVVRLYQRRGPTRRSSGKEMVICAPSHPRFCRCSDEMMHRHCVG